MILLFFNANCSYMFHASVLFFSLFFLGVGDRNQRLLIIQTDFGENIDLILVIHVNIQALVLLLL